jgi:hypothetical protein
MLFYLVRSLSGVAIVDVSEYSQCVIVQWSISYADASLCEILNISYTYKYAEDIHIRQHSNMIRV